METRMDLVVNHSSDQVIHPFIFAAYISAHLLPSTNGFFNPSPANPIQSVIGTSGGLPNTIHQGIDNLPTIGRLFSKVFVPSNTYASYSLNHPLGSAWEFDETTQEYYLHLYLPQQPDLNWDNPEVRDAVFKLMKFWLDRGCDGFRVRQRF
jgi:hypothetical protein